MLEWKGKYSKVNEKGNEAERKEFGVGIEKRGVRSKEIGLSEGGWGDEEGKKQNYSACNEQNMEIENLGSTDDESRMALKELGGFILDKEFKEF